ncbi:hypothetical protein Scep_028548 [Stephania cephalantha]|uniref:Uncharacterized protein n=1 Tax=Stephania cephalantha TaxID=152367 RepID=A0AAP0EA55_9MAGN
MMEKKIEEKILMMMRGGSPTIIIEQDKKKMMITRGEEDRLSDLPDQPSPSHLLLPLHQRRRSLNMSSLQEMATFLGIFSYLSFSIDREDKRSSEFVDNVLRLRERRSVLQRFRLHWSNIKESDQAVENWIGMAVDQSACS